MKHPLNTLQSLFPGTDQQLLESALKDGGGTLERAVDILFTRQAFSADSTGSHGVCNAPNDSGHLDRKRSSSPIDLTSATPLPADDAASALLAAETSLDMLSSMFPEADSVELERLLRKAEAAPLSPGITAAEIVAQQVLEAGNSFPKRTSKRKRQEGGGGDGATEKRRRTFDVDQHRKPSDAYFALCRDQIQRDFPDIPLAFIWRTSIEKLNQYPAVFEALRQAKQKVSEGVAVYRKLIRPRSYVRRPVSAGVEDKEFAADLAFVREHREMIQQESDRTLAEKFNEEEYEATGSYLECGCCYTDYPFEKMVQCDDGHLFCSECARRAAETNIGLRRVDFPCISSDGCKFSFPRDQILRFLSKKAFEGWENIKAEEEIRMARLDGLVKCPFCDFAAVVLNENDKEFRCQAPDCLAVSCRRCRNKSHIPQTCEEYAKENDLEARHAVEEAMTEALCRQCPKCGKRFFKEEGCNKMACSCGTRICYVCRAVIKDYDHFGRGGGDTSNRCPLWDDTVTRNAIEVNAAAEDALKKTKDQQPDLHMDVASMKVALPPPKPNYGILVGAMHIAGGAINANGHPRPIAIPRVDRVVAAQVLAAAYQHRQPSRPAVRGPPAPAPPAPVVIVGRPKQPALYAPPELAMAPRPAAVAGARQPIHPAVHARSARPMPSHPLPIGALPAVRAPDVQVGQRGRARPHNNRARDAHQQQQQPPGPRPFTGQFTAAAVAQAGTAVQVQANESRRYQGVRPPAAPSR